MDENAINAMSRMFTRMGAVVQQPGHPQKDRIEGDMTPQETMNVLSERNPTAMECLEKLWETPHNPHPLLLFLSMDSKRIYADKIAQLWEGCGKDVEKMYKAVRDYGC